MEWKDVLFEKINNLDDKLNDFASFTKENMVKVNEDIKEIKVITTQTREQATITNSRVFKLEHRADKVDAFQSSCPGLELKDKMKFALFIREHYKVLLPAIGGFVGALAVVYTLLMALIGNVI